MNNLDKYSIINRPSYGKAAELWSQIPTDRSGDFDVSRNSIGSFFDKDGVRQEAAVNVPRVSFDLDKKYRGLIVESSATNTIRNNSAQGAVVGVIGSGGSLPPNYNIITRGLTAEVVAVGAQNGIDYFDLRLFGTASTSAAVRLDVEAATVIAALTGQTWSISSYFSVLAGNADSYELSWIERTGAGTAIVPSQGFFTPNNQLLRYGRTAPTTGGATVEFISPNIGMLVTSGLSYDFTVRIGMPQMERVNGPTSVIRTTGGSVTRLADDITTTNVPELLGQSEGTLFAELEIGKLITGTRGILEIRTSSTQSIALLFFSNGALGGYIINGTDQLVRSVAPQLGISKIALVYSAGSSFVYLNGNRLGSVSSSVNVPPTEDVQIGRYAALGYLNENIRLAAISKIAISEEEAKRITTL